MSDQDAGPITPEELARMGGDVGPGSSPEQGVQEGPPDQGTPAPKKLADGTPDDKPIPFTRFREVNEERNALRARLEMYEAVHGPMDPTSAAADLWSQPEPEPAPQVAVPGSETEEGAEDWLEQKLEGAVRKAMEPFVQSQQREKAQALAEAQLSALEAKYEGFDRARDGAQCWQIIRQRRASTFEDAYKILTYDRLQRPAAPTSPGHDIPGSAPQETSRYKEIVAQLNDPNANLSNWQREQLVQEAMRFK